MNEPERNALADEQRKLLGEMYQLLLDGKVRFVESLGGGIWTWPDRCADILKKETT